MKCRFQRHSVSSLVSLQEETYISILLQYHSSSLLFFLSSFLSLHLLIDLTIFVILLLLLKYNKKLEDFIENNYHP